MNSAKEILSTVNTLFKTAVAYGTSAVLIGGGTLMYASNPQMDDSAAQMQIGDNSKRFVVEIKEHLSTNRQNDINPAEGDKVYTRGDYAVLDGTIYPDGSIPRGHNAEPVPGARPLGKYAQRGVFTTEIDQFLKAVAGDRDVSPTVAFFTEVLVFEDGSTILMDGLWPNAYFAVHRVVLGGTGRFRDVVGEVLEENIGEDTDGLCNLRMTFRIRKAARFGEQDR